MCSFDCYGKRDLLGIQTWWKRWNWVCCHQCHADIVTLAIGRNAMKKCVYIVNES